MTTPRADLRVNPFSLKTKIEDIHNFRPKNITPHLERGASLE
jgi:hypothetical protein